MIKETFRRANKSFFMCSSAGILKRAKKQVKKLKSEIP
jgi:hypothetical protein